MQTIENQNLQNLAIFFYFQCNAYEMQNMYDRMKVERDEKLQRFQSEVSQRVSYMEQLKQKHLKLHSIKKVIEIPRHVYEL